MMQVSISFELPCRCNAIALLQPHKGPSEFQSLLSFLAAATHHHPHNTYYYNMFQSLLSFLAAATVP